MSVDGEPVDFDESGTLNGLCQENATFEEDSEMKNDVDEEKSTDYEPKFDRRPGSPVRPMRQMRPQFRPMPGPRPPFPCNFRGPPRGMPPGPGNMRGFPYMRPGMGPNPSGPPFDFNGPPPMGMPRNCPPPRFPPGPHRFPPMNDGKKDEDNNEGPQSYEMNRNADYELAPPNSGGYPNYPPGVRAHGPPPFINGAPGGMPNCPPMGNQGYPGAAPGPPFALPPGIQYSGPPASSQGVPFNAPPFHNAPTNQPFSAHGPGYGAPNAPFGSPPVPFSGHYGGPPGPAGFPPGGHNFPIQAGMEASISGLPSHSASAVLPSAASVSQQNVPQSMSHGSQPGASPGPSNGQRFSNQAEMSHFSPPISNGSGIRHPLENSAVPVPSAPGAPINPIPPTASTVGTGNFATAPPPSIGGVSAMSLMPNSAQPCELPPMPPGYPSLPVHMMPPPIPSIMPPFRPPMPQIAHMFMPANVKSASDDIWVENFTAEGKPYYYSMRTRETRWDRPDNVTIVRQGEFESSQVTSSTQKSSESYAPSGSTIKPLEVAVWCEYINPEGKAYYHNSKTGETTWEKPKALSEWEATASNGNVGTVTLSGQTSSTGAISQDKTPTFDSKPQVQSSTPLKPDNVAVSDKTEDKPLAEQKADEGNDKASSAKICKDTSRPVSSTAVPGTPWCVVWTGDDRAFFFNPSQRLSVWERPDELKGRTDVDRLLEKPVTSNISLNEGQNPSSDATDSIEDAPTPKKAKLDVTEVQSGTFDTSKTTTEATEGKEQEKGTQEQDKIAIGREAAKEAEERAARERAVQPLEIRVRRFREMLVEMQVSAFSTWEKELHKIVFDPRYLLLTSKERKQTFEAYVKERADEERKEKKNKLKECREKFNELLEEARLTTKSTFTEVSTKFAKDDRFRGIEKSRDREALFQDHLSELRKREKEDKNRDKEKVRSDFLNILKEQSQITKHTHWSDVKRKIDSDPRYRAVESSSRREDLYREYVKKLPEVTASEEGSTRKEKERRGRERDKDRGQSHQKDKEGGFRSMLSDLIRDSNVTWREAKKILRRDDRWDSVADTLERSEREEIFKEYVASLARRS